MLRIPQIIFIASGKNTKELLHSEGSKQGWDEGIENSDILNIEISFVLILFGELAHTLLYNK